MKFSEKYIIIDVSKIKNLIPDEDNERCPLWGAEEAICICVHRIFQAKVSLLDGPLESSEMTP